MHSKVLDLAVFGCRLRSLRVAYAAAIDMADLSAAEFARMLAIAPLDYEAFEGGVREPSISVLLLLHRKTGVSLDWLVAHDGSQAAGLTA